MDQLVVALDKCDRIAEFLPYVAALARPGMTISFLVHYASTEFQEVMEKLVTPTLSSDLARASSQRQATVDMHVAALRQPGVELKVSIYSGSARKALRQFITEQSTRVLIMRGATRCGITRALRRARWLGKLFARGPASSPVVLVQNPSEPD